jgi:UDP-2,3-diacylglucosamine pyrophosphatase LpxH
MIEPPVLVVSDTHFGFLSGSADRFQQFVEGCLQSWVQRGETKVKKTGENLAAPRTIMLLGDIIDLWVSRDKNIIRPYEETSKVAESLVKLRERGCKIVYVVGNHDYIVRVYPSENPPAGAKMLLGGVPVYPDRYPDPDVGGRRALFRRKKWEGFQIGEKTYLFLHGHQFDPFNSNHSWLRLMSFLGFTSASAEGFWKFEALGKIALGLFVGLAVFTVIASLLNWLPLLPASFATPLLIVDGLILGVLAAFGGLWAAGWAMRRYYNRFGRPGHIDTENATRPKPPKPISEVIMTSSFRWKKRYIYANVVVFGHTHFPEICRPSNGKIEALVNTGSWIEQNNREIKYDTFVYIDEKGPRLFQWLPDEVEPVANMETAKKC